MSPIPVVLRDVDCGLDPACLHDLAEALTVVSHRDFGRAQPYGWGLGAVCRVAKSPTDLAPGEWPLEFRKVPTVPGALGEHHTLPDGRPVLLCFPELEASIEDLPVTASHELFEALADPETTTTVVCPDGRIRALETADPVEGDSYEYRCLSGRMLRISNFVTPSWFTPAPGVPFDFLGLCTQPGQLRAGGYQIYYDPHQGWTQEFAGERRSYRAKLAELGLGRGVKRQHRQCRRDPLDALADLVSSHMPASAR